MRPLSPLLGIRRGRTVAVVGCGGKTSLLLALAREWREEGVLLSTTTKMARQELEGCDFLYTSPGQWRAANPRPGIHGAGVPMGAKLHPLPGEDLEALCRRFPLAVLECDGSRRLPLKGWREDEPVLPSWAGLTVGVATVRALGLPLDSAIAFQPELFSAISGCPLGHPVSSAHLAAAIAHPRGLFQHSRGQRALFFSQAEDPQALSLTEEVLALLPQGFREGLSAVCIHGQ